VSEPPLTAAQEAPDVDRLVAKDAELRDPSCVPWDAENTRHCSERQIDEAKTYAFSQFACELLSVTGWRSGLGQRRVRTAVTSRPKSTASDRDEASRRRSWLLPLPPHGHPSHAQGQNHVS
jgi:hypothetical protein